MKQAKIMVLVLVCLIMAMVIKNNVTPFGLGVEDGQLKPLFMTPNGVSSQTEDEAKYVDPIAFIGDLENSKALIKKACEAYGGIRLKEESETYLHYVFVTDTMGFKDDVEFYFDEERQIIHYRSQSRIGYSDMGLNRTRYESVFQYYMTLKP